MKCPNCKEEIDRILDFKIYSELILNEKNQVVEIRGHESAMHQGWSAVYDGMFNTSEMVDAQAMGIDELNELPNGGYKFICPKCGEAIENCTELLDENW